MSTTAASETVRCGNCERDREISECKVFVVDVDTGGRKFAHFGYSASKFDREDPYSPKVRGYVEVQLSLCCPECEDELATARAESDIEPVKVLRWERRT